MGKPGSMKPTDCPSNLYAHVEICKECTFLICWEETISEFSRSKPFPFFFLTIERATAKEIFAVVEWHYYSRFAIPLYHLCRPSEHLFPVFSARSIKDFVSIYTDYIVNTFFVIGVYWSPIECYHIRLVRTEIYIFHPSLCLDFINKFYGTSICCFQCYLLCHKP